MYSQRCIVFGCESGVKIENVNDDKEPSKNDLQFFQVPKIGLDLWQRAISRSDIVIKPGHLVCERHFLKTDVLPKREYRGPCGEVGASADIHRLKEGVVPSIRLGFETDIEADTDDSDSVNSQFEEISDVYESDSDADILNNFEEVESDVEIKTWTATEVKLEIPNPVEETPIFEIIFNNPKSIALPPVWCRQNLKCNGEKIVLFTQFGAQMEEGGIQTYSKKQVIVDRNLETTILLSRQRIPKQFSELNNFKITSLEDLEHMLKVVNTWKLCAGLVVNSEDFKSPFVRMDKEGIARSVDCCLQMPPTDKSNCCEACKRSKIVVRKTINRLNDENGYKHLRVTLTEKQKIKLDAIKKELKTMKRGRERALARVKALKELRIQEKEAYIKSQKTLQQMINESCLEPIEKLVMIEMFNASKLESARGRRYTNMWLEFCLILYKKSPSIYKFLKYNNVLPLPASQTLFRFAQLHPLINQNVSKLIVPDNVLENEETTEITFENEIVPSDELPEIEMETEIS